MVHTIIRTTIGQYYVNKAVTRGFERANMQPGSVTFIQRFGSAINLNLHFHCVFLEGVYLDRTEAGLTPRFVTGEPPTDADIAAVITKISHRVMRKLRQLDTWRLASTRLWPPTMIPCAMTPPSWPEPWPPRCSSASPLASGLDSRSGALARALAPRASALS
jgi:hypothetical protein